jgi:hypothetical protein
MNTTIVKTFTPVHNEFGVGINKSATDMLFSAILASIKDGVYSFNKVGVAIKVKEDNSFVLGDINYITMMKDRNTQLTKKCDKIEHNSVLYEASNLTYEQIKATVNFLLLSGRVYLRC